MTEALERPPGGGHLDEPAPAGGRVLRAFAGSELLGILAPVVVVAVAMTLAFPGFASVFNIEALLATVAVTALVGLAQLSVLAIGQFNLALPAMGAFTGMVAGWLLQVGNLPWPIAIALALAFAGLLGILQGAIIVRLRLNAFIVTLGLASAYYGAMYVVLGNERFQKIGTALPGLGRGAIGPIPNIFIVSMLLCALTALLVQYTVTGRQILAVGASPLAARFSALPVGRTVIVAHLLSGLPRRSRRAPRRRAPRRRLAGDRAGLAAHLVRRAGARRHILAGGKVSVVGTILGAALLAMIANALVIVGVSQYWYQAGLGLIILGAVTLDQLRLKLITAGKL